MTPEHFDEVLAAARDGAEWAWTELYDTYVPSVLGYLHAQRAPHPEDTTSEVFLQLVRDLDQFAGSEENFRSWLFTIAHHRLIDSRRYDQRRPSDPTETERLVRLAPSIEEEDDIVEGVTTEELETLFACLTPDQRDVLFLKIVGGLSLPEVADVLGKGYESVRGLQKRALASLRAELADNPYPFMGGVPLTTMR